MWLKDQTLRSDGRTSLGVQCVGVCLPVWGTRVQSLVQEDPTYCGAAKPLHHDCGARVLQLVKPARPQPVLLSTMCARVLSHFSRVWLFVTPWTVAHWAPLAMGFSRQDTGVGCYALLQGIFPTQGSNSCLPEFPMSLVLAGRVLYQ